MIRATMFLLQNETAGYVGNAPMWWAVCGGYTDRLDDAQPFAEAKADEIIRSTKGTHRWRKWPLYQVRRASHRTVDIQRLRMTETQPITNES